MSVSQAQVDQYLTELRQKGNEATTTFGADGSEVTKHRDGRVTVTLFFDTAGQTPAQVKQAENAATDAAEQFRGFDADAQVASDGNVVRAIGVFDAP
jgi:hypothetical protein